MGYIRNFIFGDPEDQGMKYRIRVFDHGHHIKTATVKDRGQRRIELVVKPKDWGFLGEEVKLAFMINPEIPPRYFGNIAEIDFDVRDSTQLADLFDLCPDLVSSLNKSYSEKRENEKKQKTIDAEYTLKKENDPETTIDFLTDPASDPDPEIDPKELTLEEKIEKIPGVKTTVHIIDAVTSIPHNIKTNIEGVNQLLDIETAPIDIKNDLVKKTLDFCSQPRNQKCLRWLPKYLKIEPEISAIVSQSELDGVGIMPMYYIKQSNAEISEKMLQRPKSPEDWKTTALYIIGILAVLAIFAVLVLKLSGKM